MVWKRMQEVEKKVLVLKLLEASERKHSSSATGKKG